jgi:hypothetical protein
VPSAKLRPAHPTRRGQSTSVDQKATLSRDVSPAIATATRCGCATARATRRRALPAIENVATQARSRPPTTPASSQSPAPTLTLWGISPCPSAAAAEANSTPLAAIRSSARATPSPTPSSPACGMKTRPPMCGPHRWPAAWTKAARSLPSYLRRVARHRRHRLRAGADKPLGGGSELRSPSAAHIGASHETRRRATRSSARERRDPPSLRAHRLSTHRLSLIQSQGVVHFSTGASWPTLQRALTATAEMIATRAPDIRLVICQRPANLVAVASV